MASSKYQQSRGRHCCSVPWTIRGSGKDERDQSKTAQSHRKQKSWRRGNPSGKAGYHQNSQRTSPIVCLPLYPCLNWNNRMNFECALICDSRTKQSNERDTLKLQWMPLYVTWVEPLCFQSWILTVDTIKWAGSCIAIYYNHFNTRYYVSACIPLQSAVAFRETQAQSISAMTFSNSETEGTYTEQEQEHTGVLWLHLQC